MKQTSLKYNGGKAHRIYRTDFLSFGLAIEKV